MQLYDGHKRGVVEASLGMILITSGALRGRKIAGPRGAPARPTAAKVRQAFFNILGPKIVHSRFLDLFAGTGAMGFEALSRGASTLVSVEKDRRLAATISSSLEHLGITGKVVCADALKALAAAQESSFDVIFADPPYSSPLLLPVLKAVNKHQLLAAGGILAVEHLHRDCLPDNVGRLQVYDRRQYGQTAISFYCECKVINEEP